MVKHTRLVRQNMSFTPEKIYKTLGTEQGYFWHQVWCRDRRDGVQGEVGHVGLGARVLGGHLQWNETQLNQGQIWAKKETFLMDIVASVRLG